MKSIQLLYPHHSVINLLQKLLRIKRYEILLMDESGGVIGAVKKRWLQRDLFVKIQVAKVDNNITLLTLTMNYKPRLTDKRVENVDGEEEGLLDSIEKYL
jgi:hypothetical protein